MPLSHAFRTDKKGLTKTSPWSAKEHNTEIFSFFKTSKTQRVQRDQEGDDCDVGFAALTALTQGILARGLTITTVDEIVTKIYD